VCSKQAGQMLGQAIGGGPDSAHSGPQKDPFLVDIQEPVQLTHLPLSHFLTYPHPFPAGQPSSFGFLYNQLHGSTSQKALNFIFAAVRT
jgi:hypothetical protein